jgi:hypothetical protein
MYICYYDILPDPFTCNAKHIKPLDRMAALDLAVKLENGRTMAPNTFIDAP